VISSKYARSFPGRAICWAVLGFSVHFAFGSSITNTNTNRFVIDENVRIQLVAPGDKIYFVDDNDVKKSAFVKLSGGATSLCSEGTTSGISTCTVDRDAGPGPYYFALCPDKTCTSTVSPTGQIEVSRTLSPSPNVWIALAQGSDVNHVLVDGDTIMWTKINGKAQSIKFTASGIFGFLNPCSGGPSSSQNGSCTVKFRVYNYLFSSFAYNCTPNPCSDPILHLVDQNPPTQNLLVWIISSWLRLGLAVVLGLTVSGLLIWIFRR
jgi:hypothetical protein